MLARPDKYRAKNVIDVVAYRFGDVGSGWLFDGLTVLGGSGAARRGRALPVCAGWLALAIRARRRISQARKGDTMTLDRRRFLVGSLALAACARREPLPATAAARDGS